MEEEAAPAAATTEATVPTTAPPAEVPLTAVDHSNKFLFEMLKKKLDGEQQQQAAASTAAEAAAAEETEEDRAAWDEPSSAEDVYRPYLERTGTDGKPLPWGVC